MLNRFKQYISRNKLCSNTERVLLAVSGGCDSMVMLQLFSQAAYQVGVVHCNFSLRGQESDADELFVKKAAAALGVSFYSQRFDTRAFAAQHKLSLQEAARELRYQYFAELARKEGYQAIATAHQLNDQAETMLLHLLRGTGLKGMKGIPRKNGNIIRPLLFATRAELEDYARQQGVAYRDDSSNSSDKYTRNKIRLQVMPLLRQINPAFEQAFGQYSELATEASNILQAALEKERKKVEKRKGPQVHIQVKHLMASAMPATLLHEILYEKGFSPAQLKQLLLQQYESGKMFYSSTHVLHIDRENWILSPRQEQGPELMVQITEQDKAYQGEQFRLSFSRPKAASLKIKPDPNLAYLDAEKLSFPLTFRKMQPGDRFMPLGMKGFKKLSDFLTDLKVSRPDKAKVHVLLSGNDIVWVAGYRIDERYKLKDSSQKLFLVKLEHWD